MAKVINALKSAFLLLHLLPDGMNGLRSPPLMAKLQSSCQVLADGHDESAYVGITCSFCSIQLVFNKVVGIVSNAPGERSRAHFSTDTVRLCARGA